jgi:hypothetical protein
MKTTAAVHRGLSGSIPPLLLSTTNSDPWLLAVIVASCVAAPMIFDSSNSGYQ